MIRAERSDARQAARRGCCGRAAHSIASRAVPESSYVPIRRAGRANRREVGSEDARGASSFHPGGIFHFLSFFLGGGGEGALTFLVSPSGVTFVPHAPYTILRACDGLPVVPAHRGKGRSPLGEEHITFSFRIPSLPPRCIFPAAYPPWGRCTHAGFLTFGTVRGSRGRKEGKG